MKRLLATMLMFVLASCGPGEARQAAAPASGGAPDPERGRILAAQYGCHGCHVVPGIEGARRPLGPTLAGIGSRQVISNGTVPNTIENLAQFIQNPASLNPRTAMPPMGVAPEDARDIAAYLLTLR